MMNFEFTGLNDIKPEMIAEATKNARLAAEQFARDSGSKVGKIKNATQGLFSIDKVYTIKMDIAMQGDVSAVTKSVN